ncbi:MAG TPA: hypothetical protein VHH73_00650, partial [Verrucomicrobiae bacterium]|nr:hypothetical protein [Verrucomicrobiae bacterium]
MKRWRDSLGPFAIAVILGVTIYVTADHSWRSLLKTELPDLDDLTFINKAIDRLVWPPQSHQKLSSYQRHAWIRQNEPALRMVRRGLKLPYHVTDPACFDFRCYCHEHPATGLAELLVQEGNERDWDRMPDCALRCYLDVVKLGTALTHGGPTEDYSFGIRLLERATRELKGARTHASRAGCRTVARELRILAGRLGPAANAIHFDRVVLRHRAHGRWE